MSKKILLTGVTGGFGLLTAKSLIDRGHQVVGTTRTTTGRNEEASNQLRAMGVKLLEMDVTNEDQVNAAVAQAIEELGGLDVVINNAGLGVMGMQEHFTPEDWRYIFDVNVFGVQRVMRASLPHMRAQGKGLAIYVSSLLGRITLPFYGAYNASKWALEAMAENYRTELSGFGIESAIVEPGGFPTAFGANLMKPSDNSRDAEYGDFMNVPVAMAEGFGQALANNPAQDPQLVADAIADLIDQPHGQRPMRTVVDKMGMGDPIAHYNNALDQVTTGIYTAFGNDGMLKVKVD